MPTKSKTGHIQYQLAKWLSKAQRVAIAGIGNPIRMDDFVGVKIIQDLKGNLSENAFLIECETVPESFVQQIVDFDPTHILLIDAALLGMKPGESKLVKPERLVADRAFSTHMLPIRIFCEHLSKMTKAEIALLLIEPRITEFGEGLSKEVEASAQEISEILLSALRVNS